MRQPEVACWQDQAGVLQAGDHVRWCDGLAAAMCQAEMLSADEAYGAGNSCMVIFYHV